MDRFEGPVVQEVVFRKEVEGRLGEYVAVAERILPGPLFLELLQAWKQVDDERE
jgi:hypothetical protein